MVSVRQVAVRRVARGATLAGLVLLLASFAGRVHPVGDSLAVFRLGLAPLVLTAALGTRWPRRWIILIWLFGLAACASVGVHKWPGATAGGAGSGAGLVIYQKNMFHQNTDIAGLADDILDSGADIVTLQEVSLANEALLRRLRGAYPTQHICRYSQSSGLAVLTRLEAAGDSTPFCATGLGAAGLRVATRGGPVWVLSLHFTWPWPKPQAAQHTRLEEVLTGIAGPRILSGDFNMVPWSYRLRRLARVSETRRAAPSRPSFSLHGLPLPIDHVFAPHGGRVVLRGWNGSDHRGVLAKLGPIHP